MLCKTDQAYKVLLNDQEVGSLPRLGAFSCRHFLEIEHSAWAFIQDRNRLVVSTAEEEMCIGGFVLEIETEEGWIRSAPTTFYTNSSRWDCWNTHGLRHIGLEENIVVDLVFQDAIRES
jgi:hypothetical protein